MNFNDFIKKIISLGYNLTAKENKLILNINDNNIIFDKDLHTFSIEGINFDHKRIFDLKSEENMCVVMLLIKLFKKGYSKDVITLEKSWQLGHDDSGYLDVMIQNPNNNDIYMIEVKKASEIKKYVSLDNEKKIKQVFSYAVQEKTTKMISFYTYNFNNLTDQFYNVYIENILVDSKNVHDLYERWNKIFDKSDYILSNPVFNIIPKIKTYDELEKITDYDTKILFSQFLTILRINSISDKPNAFIKMINLLLAKIADESLENQEYKIKDKNNVIHDVIGTKFQYVPDIDTSESFMKRLNELYKAGMKKYLNKNVIDYSDDELVSLINLPDYEKIFDIFDDLRLKKSNNFTFIDVYDDDTFEENVQVVKSIVELIQSYKFKYTEKHQFLGDFFEDLLNTSLKQEAGQFFTPYPLVDFIINSLPYEEVIKNKLKSGELDCAPSVIDYACGAGHFLISSMEKTQNIFSSIHGNYSKNLTNDQLRRIESYVINPYSWVNNSNVVGIEKDYRLAKTTKIATFLNGDGAALIVSGDGINKFSSKDYLNTCLYSKKNKNEIFDFVISNPPYSVDGYMMNFLKNGINPSDNVFSLLKGINKKDSAIEKMFVERSFQLLKKDGITALILPQSILSNDKYIDLRNFIFRYFKVISMVLTSDITFSGTTTSPVILFMQKRECNLDYETLIICSPKYLNPTGTKMKNKEVEFLGYEFSSDRKKSGIKIKENSMLKQMSKLVKTFAINGVIKDMKLPDNVFIKNIKDILLNSDKDSVGDIYPKHVKKNGITLSKLNERCKINSRTLADFDNIPTGYIEISDLSQINMKASSKNKKTLHCCKKGDILISSLCPKKSQIVIANNDYMVSSAIHVLSFEDEKLRNKVYNELIKDSTISQMNSLLDGFKITYAKISENNLYNNIYLDLKL